MAEGLPGWLVPVVAQFLLFLLLGGMAASVDTKVLKERFRSPAGILVGMSLQFLALPAVGCASAMLFDLDPVFGVTLLAVTSSPGGAYSNWWCSLFNADLALSIAMTTVSTIVSMIFTPLNLALYTRAAYGVGANLDHLKLFGSIGVAVVAILSGLGVSHLRPGWRKGCNVFGNVAGVALIVFSFLVSSSNDPIWDKDGSFYLAVAAPCVAGLVSAFCLGTALPCISPPEAVAVTVETGYQNTGLALAIALATFDEEDRGKAAGVPLYYQFVQIVCLPLFLLAAWRAGLTYAPPRAWLSEVILKDYQPTLSPSVVPEPVAVRPAPPRNAFGDQADPVEAKDGGCIATASEENLEMGCTSSTTAVALTRSPEGRPSSSTAVASTTAIAATRNSEGSPRMRCSSAATPTETRPERSSFRLGEQGGIVGSRSLDGGSPRADGRKAGDSRPLAPPMESARENLESVFSSPRQGVREGALADSRSPAPPRESPREVVESVGSSLWLNVASQASRSVGPQLGSEDSEVGGSSRPSTLPPQPEQGPSSSSAAQLGSGQSGHAELQVDQLQVPSTVTAAPLPSPRSSSDISRIQSTLTLCKEERAQSDDVSEVAISKDPPGLADMSELFISKEPSRATTDMTPRLSAATDVPSEPGVGPSFSPRDPPSSMGSPPGPLRLRLPPRSDTADNRLVGNGGPLGVITGNVDVRGIRPSDQGLFGRMATLS